MKRFYTILLFTLLISSAQGANVNIDALPAASSAAGSDLFECEQGGTNRKCTGTQLGTFIGNGALTPTTVNGNIVPSSVDTVALLAATQTLSSKTLASAIFGTAATFSFITGSIQCLQVSAVGATSGTGNLCGGPPGGTTGQIQTNVGSNALGGFTVSGDGTLNTSTGVLTVTKTNGTSLGTAAIANTGTSGATLGFLNTANTWSAAQTFSAVTMSAITGSTQCLQVNSSGVISGTSAACGGAGSTPANPTATAGPTAINGSASTFMRSDGAPAIQQGSASQKGIVQVDGTTITASGGVITAVGNSPSGANPTATAGNTAVNGSALTFMRSDAAPAIQLGSASVFGLVKVDGSTITASGGVITAVTTGGTVTNVATACGVTTASGSAITTTGTIKANASINSQTGTSYTVQSTDCGLIIVQSNATTVAYTLPQATGSFGSGFYTTIINQGAGTITITPTTSTIDGSASLTLTQFQSVDIISNGTNYFTNRGRSTGGTTSTVANGTAALGTSAISSAACASVVTASATGVATTDTVTASFNGDPTAVTGYIPSTNGMLTIFSYPTSNNVNFKVCNNTSAPVTPGAVTLNWRVVR